MCETKSSHKLYLLSENYSLDTHFIMPWTNAGMSQLTSFTKFCFLLIWKYTDQSTRHIANLVQTTFMLPIYPLHGTSRKGG